MTVCAVVTPHLSVCNVISFFGDWILRMRMMCLILQKRMGERSHCTLLPPLALRLIILAIFCSPFYIVLVLCFLVCTAP